MGNAATVQAIYEAFGRGDVPTILSKLADDVEWDYAGGTSTNVPWLQPRKGPAEVAGFFQAIAGMEFHAFTPKGIIGDGDTVVALVDVDFTVTATGKRLSEVDEIHVWHFNAEGKVARMRHGVDSHAHQLAYTG